MTGIFSYGDVEYDIDDAKVASWGGDGTYGTAVDVPVVNLFRIDFTEKSALGRGDGGVKLVASAIESATITIRNFGLPTTNLPILFGASNDEYNPGADAYTIQDMVVGQRMPYFGAIIRSLDNESPLVVGHSPGGALFFIPKCKVTANFQWELGDNVIVQPEMTGFAVEDDNLQSNVLGRSRFVRVKKYKRDLPQIGAAGATFPF